jgi:hypothetical protein
MTQSLLVFWAQIILAAIVGSLLAILALQVAFAIARLARSVRWLFRRTHQPTMPRTVDRTSEAD